LGLFSVKRENLKKAIYFDFSKNQENFKREIAEF